jgi:transglutaminase-like putative cysteine protease
VSRRQAALQLPARLPDSLRSLVEGWRREAAGPEEIVQAALRYFATEGFQYTLEPGTYLGPTALEDFLLRRRTGFCEHFSAAFATLMRLAGVPSRIVMGYLGGEYSERGGYMIVRQSDAHAWTEVWLEGSGWTRVDPTVSAAPARGDLDLESYLLGDVEALERFRSSYWGRGLQQFRLFWDHLNFQWYNTVVSFDEETQLEWLSWLGLSGLPRRELLLGVSLGGLAMALLGLHFWLRRPARDPDPWARAWREICARLERQGLPPRRAGEGPLAYAERAAPGHPEILALARRYAEGRYGPAPADARAFRRAARAQAWPGTRGSTKAAAGGEMPS